MSDFDRLVDIPKVRKLDMLRLAVLDGISHHRLRKEQCIARPFGLPMYI
jgi:hypothetical protein